MPKFALDVNPAVHRDAFGDSRGAYAVATVDGRRLVCDGSRDGNVYTVRQSDGESATICEFWAREADPADEDWPARSAPWERFVVRIDEHEIVEHEVAS